MSEIAVIGSSWMEEFIELTDAPTPQGEQPCRIHLYPAGDMRTTAHTLGLLHASCTFCTKYGNDMDAVQIWNDLNDLQVMLFGPTLNQPTPRRIIINSHTNRKVLVHQAPEFTFTADDLMPHPAISACEYAITDLADPRVVKQMIEKSPQVKWIISRNIPDRTVMTSCEGLILTLDDISKLGPAKEFDRICYRFCALGCRWVIIYLNDKGVYVYRQGHGTPYSSKRHGEGYENGCYSAFMAGLLSALAKHQPLEPSVLFGLVADAAVYQCEGSTNPNLVDAIQKME